jgi:cytochrome c biogenesis protein CcmG/thiol:disulfide interchange protein DsbE
MKKILFISCALAIASMCNAAEPPKTAGELHDNGAFGFPQKDSTVFCDQPTLRFSVWNNGDYLFAQAILWTDDDASLGKTDDNREMGDWSVLVLDLDADGKSTKDVDRDYDLNPWPGMEGLHYQIELGPGSTTGILSDSKGHGAIRYLKISDGKLVRVDTYLIPLVEISRHVGDKIRIVYWGDSPKPRLTVNSAGYERGGKDYYSQYIPHAQYHEYVLINGSDFDATQVPEGRSDISLSTHKNVPMPKVGESAPEISAKNWINLKKPLTLAELRGKVVVVEFWATWCGPCIECIPHLNELQRKYSGENFQLLSFVAEGHQTMDSFLAKRKVEYPVGLESSSLEDYGIIEIPHAFVIDQTGKVVWQGNSASPELEKIIELEIKLSSSK